MNKPVIAKRFFSILLMILVVLGTMPLQVGIAFADSESENMEVNVSVEGSANGPYNITITAQQLLPDAPGGQWGAETTLYFRVNNIVKLPAASAITASDSSVEIIRNSDYDLTIKGYNYSTHVGTPLTITITGATLNTDSGSLIGINEAADMYLLSNQQTYIWRDGHDYHFVADGPVTVPVVWYSGSGPKPVWDGKKASWEAEAFDSATSYDVKLIGPGNETIVDINTTALEYDFSNNINVEGRYRVNVWAKYGTDVKSATPGFADKTEKIPKLEPITVTLIPSAMDGSKVGDPVVLTIPNGGSLDSYLDAEAGRYKALVEQLENMNEGYYPCYGEVYVMDKPYSECSSEYDVYDADDEFFSKALTEDTTFYVPMDKFIDELDVTVERPMAGTQVAVQTDDGSVQDGAKGLPTTTISDDKVAKHYELPYWVTDDITKDDYDKPFNGTIQARKDYKVLIQLEPKLGWAFKKLDDPAYATINGKAVDTVLYSGHYYHDILGTVPSDFTYNLYVGGVHVTDSNKDDVLGDGTVKFDPEAVKLTLNNANIEVSRREDGDDGNEYGIRSNLGDGMAEFGDKPLTIELIGANTISDSNNDEGTTGKYGIFVASSGPVTYTGGGTLNVNMKDANTAQGYLGLEHRQSITVDGVDINIDIDGTADNINGIYTQYSNTFSLTNGSNVLVDVAKGYAYDNNVQGNKDLSVAEGCVFEAVSGGEHGALHGNNWVQLTDDTKALGAAVNTEPTAKGRTEWDGTTSFAYYQYVRIPGIKSVTVNYDLGEGHEKLAQTETLKEAINKRHGMTVTDVEGSVVKIKVPELSDNNTKNTVARLLGALQVALNESVGHDPWYGPYWVYDQDQWNFNNALKTLENYSSIDDVNDEHDAAYKNGTMPEDGQTIYALWAEPISEVAIDVESPLCGTEVTADLRDTENPDMGYDEETQTPQPVVSISTEHVSIYEEDGWEYTWWVDQTRKEEAGFTILPPCYIGIMEGDNDYMMIVTVEPDFGYYLPEDVKFIASNGTADEELSHGIDSFADAYITLTAEHEEGEPIEENRVEPTCTKEGSYDEVVYCLHHDICGKEFSRETKTIKALGHDFSDWEVTKEATVDEEGEETRTCNRCGEKEIRAIPKLDPKPTPDPEPDEIVYSIVEGDGNSWRKGSASTCDFIFERNTSDESTFSHFQGIQIDGKDVDSSNYTAESGSVVIRIKPVFLETLTVGEHTLTAIFDDGNRVDAKFTILKGAVTPSKKSSPPTGDENNIGLWIGILAVAVIAAIAAVFLKRRNKDESKDK